MVCGTGLQMGAYNKRLDPAEANDIPKTSGRMLEEIETAKLELQVRE